VREGLNGRTYWFAQSERNFTQRHPIVHLLPNYDEYLIARKDHTEVFDRSLLPDQASVEAALGGHIMVVHGRVMGGWRRTVDKNEVVIEAKPLARLDESEVDGLQRAVQRYGRFLEMPAWLA
jgi:hypothetical protein